MEREEKIKTMDAILLHLYKYSESNEIGEILLFNKVKNISWAKEYFQKWMLNSKYFKCINVGENKYALTDDGYELINAYGSYLEYLKSIKIDNNNKKSQKIFNWATAIFAVVNIWILSTNLSSANKNIIKTKDNTIQQINNTVDTYKELLRQNNQARFIKTLKQNPSLK